MMNEQPERANREITAKDLEVSTIATAAFSTTHVNQNTPPLAIRVPHHISINLTLKKSEDGFHYGKLGRFIHFFGSKRGVPFRADCRVSNSNNSNNFFKLPGVPHTLTEIP